MKRALLLLVCSCASDATRVHLDVGNVPITADSYQLRVGDRDGHVAVVTAFDVWLPDEMAGTQQDVKLWGVANGTQIAFGETTVTPVLHDTTAASLELAPCPGGDCMKPPVACMTDGDVCDDGDACTISDICGGGTCSGMPKCSTAPSNADATCSAGTCGFKCHPGYYRSGSACAAIATDGNLVFVSSMQFTGDMGGLAGADAKCQSLANTAGLPGTYKAWLSDSLTDVKTRVTQSTNKYVLIDGTMIAANYTALTSGTVSHAIDHDENGMPLATDVFTDSNPDGLATEVDPLFTCNDWTLGNTVIGEVGRSDAKTKSWTADGDGLCQSPSSIYCFQQ
jgi:hypothetical protein